MLVGESVLPTNLLREIHPGGKKMSVPPFVLPSLISLCTVLVCVGLFFLRRVRSLQSMRASGQPEASNLQLSPIMPRIPLLVLLLSWPTLAFALLASAVVGITAC